MCSSLAPHLYFALAIHHLCQYQEVKAWRYLNKAVELDHPNAISLLALMIDFQESINLPGKFSIQIEALYKMAASQGSAFAHARLAFLKTHGRPNIKIDIPEALFHQKIVKMYGDSGLSWIKKLASRGIASAQFCLATAYFTGTGVDKNDLLAFFWCSKAAQQECPQALNFMGNLYLKGTGH